MISIQLGKNLHTTPVISPTHTPTTLTPDYTPNIPTAKCHLPISPPQPTSHSIPSKHSETFDERLATSNLPPPGPSYYAARRALWLTPRSPPLPIRTPEPSTSRQRLEELLNTPGAVNDDTVWKSGIEKVWKGLAAGGTLKRRLPMKLVMKIIHSAWLRDDTWPVGAIAPEPDDVLPEMIPPALTDLYPLPSVVPTEYSSGVTTPWMITDRVDSKVMADEYPSGLVGAAD